jgi:hypothetical protein
VLLVQVLEQLLAQVRPKLAHLPLSLTVRLPVKLLVELAQLQGSHILPPSHPKSYLVLHQRLKLLALLVLVKLLVQLLQLLPPCHLRGPLMYLHLCQQLQLELGLVKPLVLLQL